MLLKPNNRCAFTLIELSIVLLIIGLIVGGVLVGRDLIKSAETRKVISQMEQLKTAYNTFRATYGGIPGDIANASTFWPSDCTDPRCNGDGNGRVGKELLNADNPEPIFLWQHLSWAKLVPAVIPATAMPSDITANAYYHVHYIEFYAHTPSNIATLSGLTGDVGAVIGGGSGADSTAPALFGQGVMDGKSALAIDKKIDDGHGGNSFQSGKVFGENGCLTADGSSGFMCMEGYADACVNGRDYNINSVGTVCLLNFSLE